MKMMKFICALLLAAAPFCARADTPPLYSPSVIVYDVTRGEILLEKNADEIRPIASLTKLMTAMIVIDNAQAMADTLTSLLVARNKTVIMPPDSHATRNPWRRKSCATEGSRT